MPTTSNAAVSGMNVVQKQIQETQLNISNTLSPDYCQHTTLVGTQVNSNGEAVGATVYGVRRETNQAVFAQYQAQNSWVGFNQVKSQYLEQLQPVFGLFGRPDDLANELAAVYTAFNTAALSPENPAMAKLALNDLERLTLKINKTANEVQNQRLNAETEIAASTTVVNGLLKEYHQLNQQIMLAMNRGKNPIDAESQRDYICLQIAKYIPVKQAPQETGINWLYLTDGTLLVSESGIQRLDFNYVTAMAPDYVYNPAGGGTLNGLYIGGRNVTEKILPGKIQGLFELRDVILPGIQNQLDAFAVGMRDQLNAAHNAGTSYHAPRTLTGNKTCQGTDPFAATGTLRVAVVGQNKLFIDYLDLNLAPLTTVQSFVNAINNATGVAGAQFMTAAFTPDNTLQIQANNPSASIALVSLDPANPAVETGTGKGISDYFGLNNMLQTSLPLEPAAGPIVYLGSANRLTVRPDLLVQPELYANGTLNRDPAPILPAPPLPQMPPPTWALTTGDNSNGLKISATYQEAWTFPMAGGIVAQQTTLKNYATQIVTINGYLAASATADFIAQNTTFLSLKEEYKQISGVSEQQEIDTLALLTQMNTLCTNAAMNLQKNMDIVNRLMTRQL